MFEYALDVLVHICIPDTNDFQSQLFNHLLPFSVILLGRFSNVSFAIYLNDQMCGRTVKIHNVFTDAILSTKLQSTKLFTFQSSPEYYLSARHISS